MPLKPIVIEFHDIFIPLKHSAQVRIRIKNIDTQRSKKISGSHVLSNI